MLQTGLHVIITYTVKVSTSYIACICLFQQSTQLFYMRTGIIIRQNLGQNLAMEDIYVIMGKLHMEDW